MWATLCENESASATSHLAGTLVCTSVGCQQGKYAHASLFAGFPLFFFVRKQVVIIMSQMVGATFWHEHRGNWENWWSFPTLPRKRKMSGKLCMSPAKADFISHVYMTINIYKERKIAGKTGWSTAGFGKINTLMTGWSWFFILVLGSEKNWWQIASDTFTERCL